MTRGRYLVLGADRKSGEPRKMLIEAKSPEDARSLAESRGMLISVVETRPPDAQDATTSNPVKAAAAGASSPRPIPRPRGTDAPTSNAAPVKPDASDPTNTEDAPPREWTDDRIGENRRDGLRTVFRLSSKTPELEPLDGEELLEVFDPSFREMGILRSWLGRSRRMVVTSRRVVVIERRRGLDNIREAMHEQSDGVEVVKGVRWLLLVPGLLLFLQPGLIGFAALIGIGVVGALTELMVGQVAGASTAQTISLYLMLGVSVFILIFSVLMIVSSRDRRIGLRTPGGFVGVRVRRVGPSETSALVGAMVSAREKQREESS